VTRSIFDIGNCPRSHRRRRDAADHTNEQQQQQRRRRVRRFEKDEGKTFVALTTKAVMRSRGRDGFLSTRARKTRFSFHLHFLRRSFAEHRVKSIVEELIPQPGN
jgi:hypothetical protein